MIVLTDEVISGLIPTFTISASLLSNAFFIGTPSCYNFRLGSLPYQTTAYTEQ